MRQSITDAARRASVRRSLAEPCSAPSQAVPEVQSPPAVRPPPELPPLLRAISSAGDAISSAVLGIFGGRPEQTAIEAAEAEEAEEAAEAAEAAARDEEAALPQRSISMSSAEAEAEAGAEAAELMAEMRRLQAEREWWRWWW